MKFLNLKLILSCLLLALLPFSMTSCSSDDNEETVSVEKLTL